MTRSLHCPVVSVLCLLTALCASPAHAAPVTQSGTFTNPIDSDGADPFVTYANGNYYLLCTDGPNDSFDANGPHHLTVRAAPSLGGLRDAPPKTVFEVPLDPDSKNPNNQFYESPELWKIGGHWYIYYTSYPNTVKVLEADGDSPQGAFHAKATLTTNTYDASVLQMPDGKLYLMGSTYGALVIQPLSNPYTVSGPQTEIAHKDQSWEQVVIEAPGAVWHNGQLTLLYSAGGYNKDNYGVGGLKLTGQDPTLAASWTKLPGPLFRGLPSAHAWCAGVAAPFLSPDGRETWFAYSGYHAYDYAKDLGQGPRVISAQPLSWAADNTPDLGVPVSPGQPLPLPSGDSGAKKSGHK